MGKRLENLLWKPMWVSHLGCVKGCLDYLKVDVTDAWLFGATGHAFIINIHDVVCPSGPTAWNSEMLFKLGENVGYATDDICAFKAKDDFPKKQEEAWNRIRKAIDEGIPCYGWELEVPEYYVIYGYDETGYHFSGPLCDGGKGPKPWKDVGDSEIGVLHMCEVRPRPAADEKKTVKDALAFTLAFAESPDKWIFPKYKAGLDGYDNWIKALETGTAHAMGTAYNSEVWNECRRLAVGFLKEAKQRTGASLGTLFDEAIGHYSAVADNLEKVRETYPFKGPEGDYDMSESRRGRAVEHLKLARAAEEEGLTILKKIVREL